MLMRGHERGFSLVELMVAMTITLIVSAAIYGLLTSGSNAFRREPELADRQQNIRVAMDLLARDVFNAGTGLPPFSQVFTIGDTAGGCGASLNGCGVMGTLGPEAASARGGDVETTDVVEFVGVDEQCPAQGVCKQSGDLFVLRDNVPRCLRLPGLALITDNTNFAVERAALGTSSTTGVCDGGGSETVNGNVTLTLLGDGFRNPAGVIGPPSSTAGAAPAVFMYPARIVRYRIGPGLDPVEPTMPALWRSESGRYQPGAASYAPEPGEAGFAGAEPWELVARGIEDLQIEYLDGTGSWQNQPSLVTNSAWSTIVRQVRITLSARATAANLQGAKGAGGGAPVAVRGQLSTTVTPRAAFNELQMGNQIH
jgi:prepilin-type N-terminal cleavage/methylation domain-containing protein